MKKFLSFLLVAMILLAVSPALAEEKPQLTLWHSLEGQDLNVLSDFARNYPGADVQLEYISPADLLPKLQAAEAAGGLPDLFIAPTDLADRFARNGGGLKPYCSPDNPDPCKLCQGSSPLPWCKYAQGDFSGSLIPSFQVNKLALCTEDGCGGVCVGPDAPNWCKFASLGDKLNFPIDIFQASTSVYIPDINGGFPWGTPVWWDLIAFYLKEDWLRQQGLEVPTTYADFAKLVNDHQDAIYFERGLETVVGTTTLPQDPVPILTLPQDPVPAKQAGIFLTTSNRIPALQQNVGDLTLLNASGYRPLLGIQGIYMTTGAKDTTAALDFMYAFTDEDVEADNYVNTGHFPANGEAFEKVMNGGKLMSSMDAPAIPYTSVEAPQ
jgi:hypothetical protein